MRVITDQSDLDILCQKYEKAEYITVDTEFLRERTYWAKLCLIQIAAPVSWDQGKKVEAALIDPIRGDLDLTPFWALMRNKNVLKIFHAARQDIEIFYHLGKVVPEPLFDTQIASMVCGLGEQISYENLIRNLLGKQLDKSNQVTNWSQRPLDQAQKQYALADVTHLRNAYEVLRDRMQKAKRETWALEELAVLLDPETYMTKPENAWQRLRLHKIPAKAYMAACALAEWREAEAQRQDLSRNRILSDEMLYELANLRPQSLNAMKKCRNLRREQREDPMATDLIRVLRLAVRAKPIPVPPLPPRPDAMQTALLELLKVMLKARAAEVGVAAKLIASAADLNMLAISDNPDIPMLSGWRKEIFGNDALRLKQGKVAVTCNEQGVVIVPVSDSISVSSIQ